MYCEKHNIDNKSNRSNSGVIIVTCAYSDLKPLYGFKHRFKNSFATHLKEKYPDITSNNIVSMVLDKEENKYNILYNPSIF